MGIREKLELESKENFLFIFRIHRTYSPEGNLIKIQKNYSERFLKPDIS